jgi:putative DNA primase/helicase
VLLAALGEYGIVLGEDYFVQTQSKRHSTEVMDLYQKRLAVQAETDEGARLNESRIKQQTGKNKIRANRMHHDKTEFEASHTFILETNHKPRIVGTDVGIWRRVLLIPFEVQIPECKRDPDLDKKLLKELPLIMRWMVAGCLKWREHGLNPPEKVRVATDKYREESDLTAAFVEECCFVSPDLKVPALALYRRYNQWANERGESPMGSKRFRERMEQMRFACKRSQRCNLYLGLNLKSYDGEPAYDTGQTNTMEHWQLNSEL